MPISEPSLVAPSASVAPTSTHTQAPEARLLHFDLLRGFIMVLMALDHASFFIAHKHSGEFWGQPQPHYDSALAFLTRLVTHLCAPGFFFLTGVGMLLFAEARRTVGWSEFAIRKHYLTRGALLIVLQLFIENPAWVLGPTSTTAQPPGGGSSVLLHFGVLYGLGAAMILSVWLLRLSVPVLVGLGALAVLTTQWLTPGPATVNELYSPIVRLLLVPGHSNLVQVFYPVVPWVGLTLFGMAFAKIVRARPAQTVRLSLALGAGLLLLFLLVRGSGGFGNLQPQTDTSWIGFLNVTKYPPSLAYVTLTLGCDLLLLAVFTPIAARANRWWQVLLVFGQTALCFYLAHLYLYALAGLTLAPGQGTSLPWMYAYWLSGLFILYWLCRRYRAFKQTTAPDSVWRFF